MILTERLLLLPATVESSRAALEGDVALGKSLAATVPAGWPPGLLDAPGVAYVRDRLLEGPEQAGWWLYFVLLPHGADQAGHRRTLIGAVGYKGPPSELDGAVEVGYGIVPAYQRSGYAREAVLGLIANAFEFPWVRRIVAETAPDLLPAIGLLRRCGFLPTGEASEPGVIRWELTRGEGRASELRRQSSLQAAAP